MASNKKPVKQLILENIGEERYKKICIRFSLNESDEVLLEKMMDRLKPDYSFDDIFSFVQEFEGADNISNVIRALSVMSLESSVNSEFRKRGQNN